MTTDEGPRIPVKITPELMEEGRAKGWTGGQLMAVAAERADPKITGVVVHMPPNPDGATALIRGGYVATSEGSYPASEWDETGGEE